MRHTLPKSNILRGYQTIGNVTSSGISIRETLLRAYVLFQTSEEPLVALGFSVLKKKIPKATNRNRIKRLMRESARKYYLELIEAARRKKKQVKIVISYQGNQDIDIRRLSLEQLEREWQKIQQDIIKVL